MLWPGQTSCLSLPRAWRARGGGRKRALGTGAPAATPKGPNQRWSLDVASDARSCRRRFRAQCVIDDLSPECLATIADTSIPGARLARKRDRIAGIRGAGQRRRNTRPLNTGKGSGFATAPTVATTRLTVIFRSTTRSDGAQALRSKARALQVETCEDVDTIEVASVEFVGKAEQVQIFRVHGSVTRDGSTPFSLYFPLQDRNGSWVILFAGVTAKFDLDAYRLAAQVAEPREIGAETPKSDPVPSTDDHVQSPPPRLLAPAQQIVTELPVSTVEARAIIDRFYKALEEHRCEEVRELRPDYPPGKCEAITMVEGPVIVSLGAFEGFELFHVAVTLTMGTKTEDFKGYAAVKRRFPDWVIVSDLVLDDVPLDKYKEKITSRTEESSAVPASVSVYDPQTVVDWWVDSAQSAEPGSAAVLAACWSATALAHQPGEELSYTSGPNTFMGPPDRSSPNTGLKQLPPEFHGAIRSVDTGGARYIALTFDVCEQNNDHAGYDGEIIDYLRQNDIDATFYLGGKWMATHQERAMQLIADPHFEIGNHTWTHGNMRVLGREDPTEAANQVLFTQAQYELLREKLLARALAQGVPEAEQDKIPAQLASFRYPYGTCSAKTLELVNNFRLPAVQWSIVSGDPDPSQSAKDIAENILSQVHPGAIVVMHANGRGWHTAEALRILVPELESLGYEMVTVSKLLSLGDPETAETCYENRPGDNDRYDRIFGRGTGD